MVESTKRLNAAFEKEPKGCEDEYKIFSGFFDLAYKEYGDVVSTFSVFDVAECFNKFFSALGIRYWWSLHDKDTWEGQLKVAHVHFVVQYPRKRRWSAVFSDLCSCFGVPAQVQGTTSDGEFACEEDGSPKMVWNSWLTMSVCVSPIGAIRYLVHASDKDKFQYSFSNIMTNDLAMAKMAMLCVHGALTSDVLADVVWECKGNVRKICKLMGLEYFQKYNSTIRMLVSQFRYENAVGVGDASEETEIKFA